MTKRRIFAFIIWFISVQGCHMKNILIIPPKNQVSIHLEESLPAEILIKNKGMGKLAVSINYAKNQRQISGFGLGGRSTGKILVKKNLFLIYINAIKKVMKGDNKNVIKFSKEEVKPILS